MLKHMFYPFYPSLFCETKPLMIGKFFRNYKMFWQWSCWGQMWTVWLKKCSLLWVLSSLCTHGNVENEQQLVVVEVQYALVWIPSFFSPACLVLRLPRILKTTVFKVNETWNLTPWLYRKKIQSFVWICMSAFYASSFLEQTLWFAKLKTKSNRIHFSLKKRCPTFQNSIAFLNWV